MKAIATLNFLFYPPDNSFDKTFVFSDKSTSYIIFGIASYNSSELIPLNVPNSSKCSSTVKSSYKMLC